MQNLVLNKTTSASSFVSPYSPNRAIDGSISPTSRWLCNQLPGYMVVDLGGTYWFNRWVVRNMSAAGWPANYYMNTYSFQGSNDGANWYTLDNVSGISTAIVDRTITPIKYRFVRLYVTSGLNCNPGLASLMEFEVYEAPPTSSNLTALTISQGTLTPSFSSSVQSYTATVDNEVTSITVTPTSEDGGTITVNGTTVASGTASTAINLNVGLNSIPVVVTSRVGDVKKTYTIQVTRQANPYLTGLVINGTDGTAVNVSPAFSPKTMIYSADTYYDTQSTPGAYSITLTPSADVNATIKVNGSIVTNGQPSSPISLNVGINNAILIQVISNGGTVTKDYSITVTRDSNANLTGLALKGGGVVPIPISPTFNTYTIDYKVANVTATSVTVTPISPNANAIIKVNGIIVQSGSKSQSITIDSSGTIIYITVQPDVGNLIKTYSISINK